jgi:hypothetical protein
LLPSASSSQLYLPNWCSLSTSKVILSQNLCVGVLSARDSFLPNVFKCQLHRVAFLTDMVSAFIFTVLSSAKMILCKPSELGVCLIHKAIFPNTKSNAWLIRISQKPWATFAFVNGSPSWLPLCPRMSYDCNLYES